MKIDKNVKLKDLPEEVVEKLFKEAWQRYEERKKKKQSENSKSDDKQRAKTEFSSSTRDEGECPDRPECPGKSGQTGHSGQPKQSPVDDENSKTRKEAEKNRISERLIDRDVVIGKDGRKVTIDAYDAGIDERIEGDKVVCERKLKFVLKYKDVVKECVDLGCRDAVKEIAKATHRSPSAKEIMKTILELRKENAKSEEVPLIDYVRKKYADRLAEIEKDPFAWILQRTREIVGYDRLKLLTFLAIVSSQMQRVMGMSRIHLMLVGKSGAGKSSTIKSVLRFIDSEDMLISGTRLTQNALGYLGIDTFDGKVLFIEQIDRQNLNYIREMMTEEKICTLVTEKIADRSGERFKTHMHCIPGQAVVVTTSVADTIDVDREQIFNRFLKVYVNPESLDLKNVVRSILTRQSAEISDVDRLVFMAYLKTRPPFADITPVLDQAEKFVLSLQEYTREPLTRVTEVLRNLVIAVAIARGKTKADESDFQFVMSNFQLDVLYNGLGLTEGDVEIVKLLSDNAGLKSAEIADRLRVSKQYAINMLKNLERKGIVEGNKDDGKTFTWYLTPLGRKIKALISNVSDVIEIRDEKGELIGAVDSKFRPDTDRRDDRENAMPRNDTRAVQRSNGENDSVIKKFEDCLGFSLGAISYQLQERSEINEEQLMKLFKGETDVVNKVEECLPVLGYHQDGGVFRKQPHAPTYKNSVIVPDWKCTTIWFAERYNAIKGKTLKVKDIDDDLMMCLKMQNKIEVIDDETVHIKED